jgi:hypothetical protein
MGLLRIRSSIEFRLEAILFHYKLLESIHNPEKPTLPNLSNNPMLLIPFKQCYLFESIVFHCISLFDYLSCLINIVYEQDVDKHKKPWQKLIKLINSNSDLKNTDLGKELLETNNKWVNDLMEYRASLIHYRSETLLSHTTFSVKSNEIEMQVFPPKHFKKKIKRTNCLDEEESLNINSTSLWIIDNCFKITHKLLEILDGYIEENRKIPKEEEIHQVVKAGRDLTK